MFSPAEKSAMLPPPTGVGMPQFDSPHFGTIEYTDDQVVEFPQGLPAFEDQTRFLAHQRMETQPVIYLQSLTTPNLCFITLPVETVVPAYRLSLSVEDRRALGLDETKQPQIPTDGTPTEVLCLAIVTIPPSESKPQPTANLAAPVIIHRETRRAIQAIQTEGWYSHQHPLPVGEGTCS
jgi:flagellar assembly factor FliW